MSSPWRLWHAIFCSYQTHLRYPHVFDELQIYGAKLRDIHENIYDIDRYYKYARTCKIKGPLNSRRKIVDERTVVTSRKNIARQSGWTHFKAWSLPFRGYVFISFRIMFLRYIPGRKAKVLFLWKFYISNCTEFDKFSVGFLLRYLRRAASFSLKRPRETRDTIPFRQFIALLMKSEPKVYQERVA